MLTISQFFNITLLPHNHALDLPIGLALLAVAFGVVVVTARHYDSLDAYGN